jgi:hypothetical protein
MQKNARNFRRSIGVGCGRAAAGALPPAGIALAVAMVGASL